MSSRDKAVVMTSRAAGAALRALRLERGVDAHTLQDRAGVLSLSFVEEGRGSVGDMDKVARALGSTLPDVMSGAKQRAASDLSALARAIVELPEGRDSKIDRVAQAAVLHAFECSGGNQSEAARLLGMERKAFARRLTRARRTRRKGSRGRR